MHYLACYRQCSLNNASSHQSLKAQVYRLHLGRLDGRIPLRKLGHISLVACYMLTLYLAIPLWIFSAVLFSMAWVFQFIGHKIEGEKPSFVEDLLFLLVGPAWLLGFIYQRIGIRY